MIIHVFEIASGTFIGVSAVVCIFYWVDKKLEAEKKKPVSNPYEQQQKRK